MLLESLPTDLLARIFMNLELEMLSRCDQLSRLFHGQDSPVEKALRQLANDGRYGVPEMLPSNHANWTQALLFGAMLRRNSHRKLIGILEFHSAFVDADGTFLICGWDTKVFEKDNSLLGHGVDEFRQSIPKPIQGLEGVRVLSIAAHWNHMVVLAADGTAFSWGTGICGQLGHGEDDQDVKLPQRIMGLINVRGIATEFTHTLATTSDGALWSWGHNFWADNECGWLGHGDECCWEYRPRRLEALGDKYICAIAVDNQMSYAIDADGGSFAWGNSSRSKELGIGLLQQLPVRIPALSGELVSTIAAYYGDGCATTWQGDVWQWGSWAGVTLPPTPLKGTPLDGHRVVSVDVSTIILALTDDGTVFSWACSAPCSDPLGHGDGPDTSDELLCTPRPLKALLGQRICSISDSAVAGWANTAATSATDGEVAAASCLQPWACWTWGKIPNEVHGYRERLGHGSDRVDTNLPQRVMAIGAGAPLTATATSTTPPSCESGESWDDSSASSDSGSGE